MLGLLREGLLQAPLPGFDRERVRFEHRFGAFTRLPAPPSAAYRDFRTAAQAAGSQVPPVLTCHSVVSMLIYRDQNSCFCALDVILLKQASC